MSAMQSAATDQLCLDTYRENLLLDPDNPIFRSSLFLRASGLPTPNLVDLAKPNSEDAVTWSVFRLLDLHFAALPWLTGILKLAGCHVPAEGQPHVSFWEKADPPKSRLLWLLDHLALPQVAGSKAAQAQQSRYARLLANTDYCRDQVRAGKIRGRAEWVLERATEIDVVLRIPHLLVAVEAKFGSDIQTARDWDKERDQIARTVDAGLELATSEGRDFAFLLVTDAKHHLKPLKYEALMSHYLGTESLPIASDRLGWTTWSEIYHWLEEHHERFTPDQNEWVAKLQQYLLARKLITTRG